MFCLYHFSVKCIIKKIIYHHTVPLIVSLSNFNNVNGRSGWQAARHVTDYTGRFDIVTHAVWNTREQ